MLADKGGGIGVVKLMLELVPATDEPEVDKPMEVVVVVELLASSFACRAAWLSVVLVEAAALLVLVRPVGMIVLDLVVTCLLLLLLLLLE